MKTLLKSLLSSAILALPAFAVAPHDAIPDNQEKLEAYIKFTKVLNLVEEEYVDTINVSELVDKAIKGLMSNLDAHSSYMNEKEFESLNIQTKGEFGGLGISVGKRDGALTVISPIEDTPAFRAGLKAGDIILKVDNKATLGMSLDEAVKIMRGKPGTKITLTIVRKGESKPLIVDIVRAKIKLKSVKTKTIGEDILYIHVTSFDSHVVERVKAAIKEHQNATGYILDLRNNPGGLLTQAVGLVDMFVDHGVIVSQKGRRANQNQEFKATKKSSDTTTPMVTIINGGSASASEIVSGALQDLKRSVVIGEKSFGKGSVQVVVPFDKQGLKITIARYYLPSGRTIQNKGVTPDVIVHAGNISFSEDQALIKESELKKHLKTELQKIDKNGQNQTSTAATNATKNSFSEKEIYGDAQLKSAIDIIKALQFQKLK